MGASAFVTTDTRQRGLALEMGLSCPSVYPDGCSLCTDDSSSLYERVLGSDYCDGGT